MAAPSGVLEFSLKSDDGIIYAAHAVEALILSAAPLTGVLVRNAARTSLALFQLGSLHSLGRSSKSKRPPQGRPILATFDLP